MTDLINAINNLTSTIQNLSSTNEFIDLGTPSVGMTLGKCKNCGSEVVLRQPWLSKLPDCKDGEFIIHCSNEDCHNYYGSAVSYIDPFNNTLKFVRFLEWEENFIVQQSSNVIRFVPT